VTLLAQPARAVAEQQVPELLIQKARRRQRRRWLAFVVTFLIAITSFAIVHATTGTPSVRSLPLTSRPLHLPPLGANGSCPTSGGSFLNNPVTGDGPYLGTGPVRMGIWNRGNIARGQVVLGLNSVAPGWFGIDVTWLSPPSYQGPFIVRGAKIGEPGRIRVWGNVLPIGGPLVVPAGPSGYGQDESGYRALPNGILVGAPGCYGLQVDGRGFSEVIVVNALPYRGSA
jgi:hypothetical protein